MSRILWNLGIENHIGYDKKPFSRFKQSGWMYLYVVRAKLTVENMYAEFRSDWLTRDRVFDKVRIYSKRCGQMNSSDKCAACVDVRDIIKNVEKHQRDKNTKLFTCSPNIEYAKTKPKKARS